MPLNLNLSFKPRHIFSLSVSTVLNLIRCQGTKFSKFMEKHHQKYNFPFPKDQSTILFNPCARKKLKAHAWARKLYLIKYGFYVI